MSEEGTGGDELGLTDVDYLTARIAALELLMTTVLSVLASHEDDPPAAVEAMHNAIMASGQIIKRGFSPKDDAVWSVVVQTLEQRLREVAARVQRESKRER